MGRIITKTSEEIRMEWPPERIRALVESGVPSFHDDITDEDIATGRVIEIPERGHAAIEAIMSGKYERMMKARKAARSEPAPGAKKIKTGARLPEPAAV